jgi:hypothetical protein
VLEAWVADLSGHPAGRRSVCAAAKRRRRSRPGAAVDVDAMPARDCDVDIDARDGARRRRKTTRVDAIDSRPSR